MAQASPKGDKTPPRSSDKVILDLADLDRLQDIAFPVPGLFPAPGTGLMAGAYSALKTSMLCSIVFSIVHRASWFNGTVLGPGMVFYVTNENAKMMKYRHMAWLRMQGLPEQPNPRNNFKIIDPEATPFQRTITRGKNTFVSRKLDLLDLDSVMLLINYIKECSAAAKTPVAVVPLDTISSLVSGRITPEMAATLTDHMKIMAEELGCFVLAVTHTHRNNASEYQGPYNLAANLDVELVVIRPRRELKTTLHVRRVKMEPDGYSLGFVAQPYTLMSDKGEPVKALAMRCHGLADPTGDAKAMEHRLEIAQGMLYGADMSFIDLCKLIQWSKDGKGGAQHGWIKDALSPMDAPITVQQADGTVKVLRWYQRGAYNRVECHKPPDVPQQPDKPEKPTVKPTEHKQETPRSRAGRKLGTILVGTMDEAAFTATLDRPLGEDRHDDFLKVLVEMTAAGALITEAGHRVIAYVKDVITTDVKVGARFWPKYQTTRAILAAAGALIALQARQAKNVKRANEGGSDGAGEPQGE